jgi:hypothetical protein
MAETDYAPASATGSASCPVMYETPQLRVIGTVQDLTEWCFYGKNIGTPDYFDRIPISTCSV